MTGKCLFVCSFVWIRNVWISTSLLLCLWCPPSISESSDDLKVHLLTWVCLRLCTLAISANGGPTEGTWGVFLLKNRSAAINLLHKSDQPWMRQSFTHHWPVTKLRLNLVKGKTSTAPTHQPAEPCPTQRGTAPSHLINKWHLLAACFFFTLLEVA